jgi:hypothetical protein
MRLDQLTSFVLMYFALEYEVNESVKGRQNRYRFQWRITSFAHLYSTMQQHASLLLLFSMSVYYFRGNSVMRKDFLCPRMECQIGTQLI